jgi:hypothetical protein
MSGVSLYVSEVRMTTTNRQLRRALALTSAIAAGALVCAPAVAAVHPAAFRGFTPIHRPAASNIVNQSSSSGPVSGTLVSATRTSFTIQLADGTMQTFSSSPNAFAQLNTLVGNSVRVFNNMVIPSHIVESSRTRR